MIEEIADFLNEPNVSWYKTNIGVGFYNLKKYLEEILRELLIIIFCNSLLTNKAAVRRNKFSTDFQRRDVGLNLEKQRQFAHEAIYHCIHYLILIFFLLFCLILY